MGSATNRYDYVRLLESCYGAAPDTQSWLAAVSDAIRDLVDQRLGLAISHIAEQPIGRRFLHTESRLRPEHEAPFERNSRAVEAMDDRTYRSFYYARRPVSLASATVPPASVQLGQRFRAAMAELDAADSLIMLAYPSPRSVLSLVAPVREGFSLPRRAVEGFTRLLLHLEAGFRLRLSPAPRAAAIFSRTGRLLHLAEDVPNVARRALQEEVTRVEAFRSPSRRPWGAEALAQWQPLVTGRWTLAERWESDGQRRYVAFENAVHAWSTRALSAVEGKVITLAAQGLLGKQVASELGISEARASECLKSAASKLGLKDRAALLLFASELFGNPSRIDSAVLSDAENRVLGLLRAGLGNARIAQLLGLSERTIAHRVSALLEKTGSSSRRALIVKLARDGRGGPTDA